jgi:hypothetical protein
VSKLSYYLSSHELLVLANNLMDHPGYAVVKNCPVLTMNHKHQSHETVSESYSLVVGNLIHKICVLFVSDLLGAMTCEVMHWHLIIFS